MWPKGNTIDDETVIGELHEGLYKLKGHPKQELFYESIEPSELWNQRISHVHYRELLMASKAVLGLLEIQIKHEEICKGCTQGKNVKKTFPNSERKTKGILEIVHSDICGPMSSSSLREYVYYVSFIDDFSRNTWMYILKWKSEVFSKFKEYKSLVENQTDRKIKTLR